MTSSGRQAPLALREPDVGEWDNDMTPEPKNPLQLQGILWSTPNGILSTARSSPPIGGWRPHPT